MTTTEEPSMETKNKARKLTYILLIGMLVIPLWILRPFPKPDMDKVEPTLAELAEPLNQSRLFIMKMVVPLVYSL